MSSVEPAGGATHSSPAIEKLREQFAPGASDLDLEYFREVSRHLDLDPWAGHICLVPYQGVFKPQLTVAGRRYIAQRTGRLRGIDGPHWCGKRRYAPDGQKLPLEWVEVWDEEPRLISGTGVREGYPYAARCLVEVADWTKPVNGTVKWSEFAQFDKNGKLLPSWGKMPSHMLGKVAESLALRRGFSEVEAAVDYLAGGSEEDLVVAEVSVVPPAEVDDPPPAEVVAEREVDGEERGGGSTRRGSGTPSAPPPRRREPRRYQRSSPYDDAPPHDDRDYR